MFYTPERSPFAQARASSFVPAGLTANDVDAFRAVLQRLPVPIIGVPDPVAVRVPPLVFVGHEIGHVVGEDFGLLDEARRRVAALGIDAARKQVWDRWLEEVFADLFGVLATGSAYIDQLAAVLAGSLSSVRHERIRATAGQGDAYPTRTLRIALCRCALETLVGEVYVKTLPGLQTWSEAYGDLTGDSLPYAEDVQPIVATLLSGYTALGQRRLSDLLCWDASAEGYVATMAREHLETADAPVPYSVRVWVAAAARAHDIDPERYGSRNKCSGLNCDDWVASSILKHRATGVREEQSSEAPAEQPSKTMEDLDALDVKIGRTLGALLGDVSTKEEG